MKFTSIFLAKILAGLLLACAIPLGVRAQENVVVSLAETGGTDEVTVEKKA